MANDNQSDDKAALEELVSDVTGAATRQDHTVQEEVNELETFITWLNDQATAAGHNARVRHFRKEDDGSTAGRIIVSADSLENARIASSWIFHNDDPDHTYEIISDGHDGENAFCVVMRVTPYPTVKGEN